MIYPSKIKPEPVLDAKAIAQKRTIKVELQVYRIVPNTTVKGAVSPQMWTAPEIRYVTKKALQQMLLQPKKYRVKVLEGTGVTTETRLPTVTNEQLKAQMEAEMREKIEAELRIKIEAEMASADSEKKHSGRPKKDSQTTDPQTN